MKQFFKTLLAYLLITFTWATLYNEILFDNTLNQMAVGWRGTPLFQFGFLTMVIQSIAIYVLYSKFYEGKNPLKESFTLIFLVGVFDICYASFIEPATFEVNPVWKFVLIKLLYSVVHFALVGLAMTFVFKINKK
ncbi:hypothetical protein [Zunongwangia pacifica]|uniref:Uncharacterized protein n=1 Tax=Zunongwangia pacifica TaxID=2911062 RepID=A0A9X1ZXF4_9FLAO|nr:hypothetical protein [Zunongwangia pacifica]MCL6218171.1 hypothetical protein [Zunongwangia pacifica]